MPFTLSHAAAVIPFRRTRLVTSALVMGSFVPDFPYLLSLSPHTAFGHTFTGMFLLDLPVALLALWLFHAFVKKPMLTFLPIGFRRRLGASVTSFSFWPWKRLGLIVLSILVGTATHLVWDAFTHNTSWIYENWTLLRGSVELPVTGDMKVFKLLEYASSAFGLIVVAVWILHWYRTTRPSAYPAAPLFDGAQRRALMAMLPMVSILGGVVRAYPAQRLHTGFRPLVHWTANTLISAIAFFLLGLLVCGAMERVLRRRQVAVERP